MREKTSKKNPKSMTGGQSLIHCLYNEGVKVIFGLPGVQIYHAIIPILDYPDMQFITTRHEQATTYMADGYARAGGKVGVAMVVPGPGLQNASAGITNAYASSSPVLIISGQINRDKISKDIGILHEINDQMDIIKPITKWQTRVMDAKNIPAAVQEPINGYNALFFASKYCFLSELVHPPPALTTLFSNVLYSSTFFE